MRLRAATLLVLFVPASACSRGDTETAPPEPTVATFTATDFAFAGPQELPAGVTTIRLLNRGTEPHHAVVARLDSGKTAADLAALAASNETEDPAWLVWVGGVSAIMPGDSAASTGMLTPGTYAVVCFISGPDGLPHVQKGMITSFQVTPAEGAMAAEPDADLEIHMVDYAFELSQPLSAGTHTIRVVNDGPQVHEVQLIRFAPGKTMEDMGAWMANPQGPPPAVALGGTGGLTAGQHNYITVTLEPGEYALICPVPDREDGRPHTAHGMVMPFSIS